ncbi:MAG: DUF1501 domain-containing protein [Planctomycetales bacterium]|nr:DUF1501 domain-containing protein [Planctomycetales bacterium]
MHCGRFNAPGITRREMLQRCATGFGGVALAALCQDPAFGFSTHSTNATHFPARAKSIIFLYMDGGVSQVDSFDPKPRLDRDHGKPFAAKMEPTQFNNNGTTFRCPWKFQRYGDSGIPVSDLFPHIGQHADRLTIVRSMIAPFSEHQTANFFLHTGTGMQGRPSMGAWCTYGLGSESANLPGFVVVNGGLIPSGGLDNFGSGFLPASHQASLFRPTDVPLANIQPREADRQRQQAKIALMRTLDQGVLERVGHVDALESAIVNYEMAFRMQTAVPDLVDLSNETMATQRMYGLDSSFQPTAVFGRECLLARRLVERGVRFIELTCPQTSGNDRWDAHSNLFKNHAENARAVDQPIGALLADLHQRGLLAETLVVFSGEFGRTPFAQGSDGRDHSPFGFSLWLCGGGVKEGHIFGATDDFGYHAIEGRTEIHDLHATMLHLLGMDHERLTYRFSGRDMRLTDVKGSVVEELLA